MTRCKKSLLVLLMAAGSPLLAPAAALAQTRQFQNWIVGCDNVNVCTAIIFAQPSKAIAAPGIPFLQIRHHPHRDATPEIRLFDPGAASGTDRPAAGGARLVSTPTGSEIAKGPTTYVADDEGNGGFRFRANRAWGLLAALRKPDRITISVGEKRNLRIEMAGLDAALAYMDKQQDLAQTPGALVSKPEGEQQDYLHPNPPDIETMKGAAFGEAFDSGIPRNGLAPVSGCRAVEAGGTALGYALHGSSILVRNDCAREPHNSLSAWYLRRQHDARILPNLWSSTMDGNRTDGALLANAEVLPKAGLVRAIRYRAATRDCGVAERWGFLKDGQFELIERREMPICRTAGPAHWIVTFRANFISPP